MAFQEASANALAGVLGSLISNTIMWPLERIRMEMQIQGKKIHDTDKDTNKNEIINQSIVKDTTIPGSKEYTPAEDNKILDFPSKPAESSIIDSVKDSINTILEVKPTRENNVVNTIALILRDEGFSGLYKGLKSALFSLSISQAIFFYIYAFLKHIYIKRNDIKRLGPLENLIIASVAGAINATLTTPLWVVNMRLTTQKHGQYKGMLDCFQKIYQKEGLDGLFSGLLPALILVSNPAIQFVTYEQMLRIIIVNKYGGAASKVTSMEFFFLGAFAKSCATLVTYPYLTVKSRLQHGEVGFTKVTNELWQNEGLAGFYHGLGPKFLQTVLNAALMFATYEKFLEWSRILLK